MLVHGATRTLPYEGGAHGVSSLDTPDWSKACLVLFGKGFRVERHLYTRFIRIIIIILRASVFASCDSSTLAISIVFMSLMVISGLCWADMRWRLRMMPLVSGPKMMMAP